MRAGRNISKRGGFGLVAFGWNDESWITALPEFLYEKDASQSVTENDVLASRVDLHYYRPVRRRACVCDAVSAVIVESSSLFVPFRCHKKDCQGPKTVDRWLTDCDDWLTQDSSLSFAHT
jgi:hypothetical protein